MSVKHKYNHLMGVSLRLLSVTFGPVVEVTLFSL
jgi:hypothetical protein